MVLRLGVNCLALMPSCILPLILTAIAHCCTFVDINVPVHSIHSFLPLPKLVKATISGAPRGLHFQCTIDISAMQ